MFFPEMDVNKYCCLFILIISLPGKAQHIPDSLLVSLPDTVLNTESTLFLIENGSSVYFSYNPEILNRETTLEWDAGIYRLREVLDRISSLQEIQYMLIGNQIVLYESGQEPDLPEPEVIDAPDIMQIRGLILGSPQNEPLAYATIWFPSTQEGTIANSDGIFLLNLSSQAVSDTIAISCMGYKEARIPVTDLEDTINTIYLEESVIPIQEVVIRRTDPMHLLNTALQRIPENYSAKPVIETAFYRESIRKDDKYVSISEAVVEVYKPGHNSGSTEQVKVLRGRKNNDLGEMDTLMVKLKAGLQTSYLLDIIRNRPDFLQEEQFYRYKYRMSDIVVLQDRYTYAIDFQQKENTSPPRYRGRIYIDLESLAFRGIEFEVDPKTISSVASSMVLKKPRKVRVRPITASYSVRYKSDGNLFYLSLIRAENRFRVRGNKRLFGNEFRTNSEMAVTGLKTGDVNRFRFRDIVNPGDIFADKLGGYDSGFWGPYNHLIPEETLEEALIRIGRLMENQPADAPVNAGE